MPKGKDKDKDEQIILAPEQVAPTTDSPDKQLDEQYIKTKLLPIIDKYAKPNITETQINKFYNETLTTLKKDGYINDDTVKKFNSTSGILGSSYKTAVKETVKFFNDEITYSNLDRSEKLLLNLSKVCNSLGLEGLSKACMDLINQEKLQAITSNRAKPLGNTIDSILAGHKLNKSGELTGADLSTVVSRVVAEREKQRAGGGSKGK